MMKVARPPMAPAVNTCQPGRVEGIEEIEEVWVEAETWVLAGVLRESSRYNVRL